MTPIISIIVPIYKTEKQLKRCIDSILSQTFADFELILIDDGSPDRCPELCDDYEKQDNRIRVIHKKNEGQARARNIGLDLAKGQYIGFVDSDDYIERDMYEKLYSALVKNNADLCICGYLYKHENSIGNYEKINYSDKEQIIDYDCFVNILYSPYSSIAAMPVNKLYKKELFSEIRFPEGRIFEDESIAHSIAYNSKRTVIIPDFLYIYDFNGNSTTNSGFSKKNFDMLFYCTERIDFFKQHRDKNNVRLAQKGYWHIINLMLKKATDPDETIKKELKKMKKQFNKHYFSIVVGKAFRFKEKLAITLYFISPRLYAKNYYSERTKLNKAEVKK